MYGKTKLFKPSHEQGNVEYLIGQLQIARFRSPVRSYLMLVTLMLVSFMFGRNSAP
jgi:hypothetical protein